MISAGSGRSHMSLADRSLASDSRNDVSGRLVADGATGQAGTGIGGDSPLAA